MAALNIRNLDETVKRRLQLRAAQHGRSMEAEVREIITEAVREPADSVGLFTTLLDRFGELGGLPRPRRASARRRHIRGVDGPPVRPELFGSDRRPRSDRAYPRRPAARGRPASGPGAFGLPLPSGSPGWPWPCSPWRSR